VYYASTIVLFGATFTVTRARLLQRCSPHLPHFSPFWGQGERGQP